ncbi:MAG TPA: sigma-54 dependent transcriptional regulator [Longimicrobiaceae bacterium]|nr:sigma-54 dependent transcriptional regulator [Longimicrobiaceae bacterium]
MSGPPAPECILLVEDDAPLREMVAETLEAAGYRVAAAANGRDALETLQSRAVDLVLTDLVMPGMRGDELLAEVRAAFPELPVIAVTAFGSIEGAVALTRAGAADYLTKPFRTQALLDSVARVLEESRPRREQARARRAAGGHLAGIVGRSRTMARLFERIGRIARSPASVLVTGETGTGKELFAAALHRASGRDAFVPVNCGAIPEHLIESELFGHVRGAFTGAERDRMGLVEAADGGTLFLDEVAELPLHLQPKLLRFLQSGEYRRVGDVVTRRADARVIAATHRDLQQRVREGAFREDLYFRIHVLSLEVPALRERPTDVPLLAEHFLADVAAREGRGEMRFSPAALSALVAHSWPGNVRELRNLVERAAVLADSAEVGPEDLPPELAAAGVRGELVRDAAERRLTLAELEREYTLEVLRRCGGNRSRAAEELGVPRRTFYRRLEEYGILAADEPA